MSEKNNASKSAKNEAKMTLKPLADRVVIKPKTADQGEKTKSGIFIPDTVEKEKPEEGEVVAVGEGRFEDGRLIPIRVKVGDKVMFSKYGYDEVKVGGVEYFILKEDSILAIIK